MKRAAIYARFSTDRQNERSVEDQLALCRDYAARHDLAVVESYDDRAVSGASIRNRLGIQYLMAAAREGRFDVVIAESTSRLGRDPEERAAIRKRLRFLGVAIMTPVDGVVTDLVDGVRAVVDSQVLEDLKAATRRGMAGVIRDKRHAGGRAYGYARVKGEPGRLVIDEATAEVVRRGFREIARGDTAREVAHRLNADGIASPRGRAWNASTINGNGRRGCGIIRNEMYIGRLVWNKVGMVKDPDTGRRVSRSNPPEARQVVEVPELAIVPPELFEAVRQRIADRRGVAPTYQRRRRYLLSGLLRGAARGSGPSALGTDPKGRKRGRPTPSAANGR